ncbi:MAG: response regulator transcription factor [Bacillota bacterium]|nr:response regulator transcription factor [Bacillota bacterium]
MRILIIEDEKKLVELIENRLKKENYLVDASYDGDDGEYKALTNVYDLIILDVMLPYKDGFAIIKDLKEHEIRAQIIMLTARSELDDRLKGFSLGADDYLTKPFYLEELVARIHTKLKKEYKMEEVSLSFHDIQLDTNKKEIINIETKESIEVVRKEFYVLECLLKNKNQIVSKDFLYDYVWGMDNNFSSNNLEAYISFIRKKLKAIDSKTNVKAIRGLGYKLEYLDDTIKE